jgi:hypothetical protein
MNPSQLDRRISNLPMEWRGPLVEILDTAETVHLWLAQIGQQDNAEALVGLTRLVLERHDQGKA